MLSLPPSDQRRRQSPARAPSQAAQRPLQVEVAHRGHDVRGGHSRGPGALLPHPAVRGEDEDPHQGGALAGRREPHRAGPGRLHAGGDAPDRELRDPGPEESGSPDPGHPASRATSSSAPDQEDTPVTRERALQAAAHADAILPGARLQRDRGQHPGSGLPSGRPAPEHPGRALPQEARGAAGRRREHAGVLRQPGQVPPGEVRPGPAGPRAVPGKGQHRQHQPGDGSEPEPAHGHGGHPQGPPGRDRELDQGDRRPAGADQGAAGDGHQGEPSRAQPGSDGHAAEARRPPAAARRVAPALPARAAAS